MKDLDLAIDLIKQAEYLVAFTGAGISVESGIPAFRGKNGLYEKYSPDIFDIEFFYSNPKKATELLKEIFYDTYNNYLPNQAHLILAEMEKSGFLKYIITQNIDNLHYKAGSKNVVEFHGTIGEFVCINCGKIFNYYEKIFDLIPPKCKICKGILKPNIVFFGEQIPKKYFDLAFENIYKADVLIILGTTGVVYPAASLVYQAKNNGAKIIEINLNESVFSYSIADVFLQGKAGDIMEKIFAKL